MIIIRYVIKFSIFSHNTLPFSSLGCEYTTNFELFFKLQEWKNIGSYAGDEGNYQYLLRLKRFCCLCA